MIAPLIFSVLLGFTVDAQLNEGSAGARDRPQTVSQARIFDLPKFAPTARIIKLSSTVGRETQKNGVDKSLLTDAAGSFDNFDAFNLEELEASSGETTSSRRKANQQRTTKEENIGDFFPESS